MKTLSTTLFLLVLGPVILAQQPEFKSLYEQWIEGRKVDAELEKLAADQARSVEDRFNASYLLGLVALQHGSASAAGEHLDRCEGLRPGTPQVSIRRAEVLLLEKKSDEAMKEIEKAAKKVGDSKALQLRQQIVQARIEIAKGDAKKAAERLEKWSKSQKKDWEIPFFLGRAYEALDKPKDCLAAYEACIANLPKQDPCIGVYALQRWAAIAVSSDKGSYGNPKLLEKAIERYQAFLERATKNEVPEDLLDNVESTIRTLKMFSQPR